ncbi:MAG: Asp23/Gls24 family envelope stress response protein [Bacilli bacterium]
MKEKTSKSNTNLNLKEIANYIGDICSETYGVVGLVSPKSPLNMLLKRDKYSEGIILYKRVDKFYVVEIHLVVAYGVKITEVASEVSKRILYFLNKEYPLLFKKVNVYVEEIRDL